MTSAMTVETLRKSLLILGIGLSFYLAFYLSFFLSSDWVVERINVIRKRFFGGEETQAKSSLSRLQSRKAEIEQEIETRRASTKFAPDVDEKSSGKKKLEDILASEIEKTPALPKKIKRDKLGDAEETSYTSRLLDAKRKIQKKQDRGNLDPNQNDD